MRVARFVARYDFKIALGTIDLCEKVIQSPDFDSLSAERVWVELEKIFNEPFTQKGLFCLDFFGAQKTKRLGGLLLLRNVFSEQIVREVDFMNRPLSPVEKFLMYSTVARLTKDEALAFKVPATLKTEVEFLEDMMTLDRHRSENRSVGNDLVEIFDRYRNHLKNGILDLFVDFSKKMINQTDTAELSKRVFDELHSIDFTEMVKGMKGPEIKEFVRSKKIEIVSAHL